VSTYFPRLRQRQRGVAIVTALLLTTLAITIVASLFWQQQVQIRSIENQRLQLQKQWVLRGALDWTRLILREDALHSTVDHLGEPWAVTLAETRLDQYVENGATSDTPDATLSGGVIDAQSRLNLTNLCCDNGKARPAEVAAFSRLLKNLQLNPSLAQAAADLMVSSQSKSTATTSTQNSGTTATSSMMGQSTPQPMKVLYVDDLLAAPGFTPEMISKLRDFVVVLPESAGYTKINVNTAPAEVLSARIDTLSMAEAATVVVARERAYFKDIADFKQRSGQANATNATNAAQIDGTTDVKTQFFLVNGNVRMNRAAMNMQALIKRMGLGPQTTTEVVCIREN
jgi:general secretion pathway protein K